MLAALLVIGCSTGASRQNGQSATDECPRYVGNTRICCGAEGEIPGVNCQPEVEEGGIYGECLGQGEVIEGKVLGALCCEGLEPIEYSGTGEDGACIVLGPPSLQVCAACGNGQCQAGENPCNCSADCN